MAPPVAVGTPPFAALAQDLGELLSERRSLSPPSFDQYKLAMDLLEKESDRFWARNNVFLLTQAALVSFYASMANSGVFFFKLLLASQALFLAMIWMGVLLRGASYVERWDHVVRVLERQMGRSLHPEVNNFLALKALNDQAKSLELPRPRLIPFLRQRTTKQIRYGIHSLLCFWALIVGYNLWQPVAVPVAAYIYDVWRACVALVRVPPY